MGDYDVALKFRDIITAIAEEAVEKHRPRDKVAVVVDYDRDRMTAEVQFAGDDTTVEARFPQNLQPKRRKNDNPDGSATGDIVRIAGHPGNYEIINIHAPSLSDSQTLVNPSVITTAGISELLAELLPQPGDCRWTFRTVAGGGTVLPGNYVLLDNSLVVRAAPFNQAWNALGNPTNGTDGTNWRVPDCRDRAPFGVGTSAVLLGDDGVVLANRSPFHKHSVPDGGAHGHGFIQNSHGHGINQTNHSGIGNAVYNETGSKQIVQQIAGGNSGNHNHGGNTDATVHDHSFNSQADHNHGGETGSGAGASQVMGWKGVNWLMKL